MLPASKQFILISQASTNSGATASGTIDTRGFDFLMVDVVRGTTNTATNNPTVFKFQEADVATYADITALVGDGVGGWTIPVDSSTVDNCTKFCIDLRGRKRFLKLLISPLTTQLITAIANLFRAEDIPLTAAKANVAALVCA